MMTAVDSFLTTYAFWSHLDPSPELVWTSTHPRAREIAGFPDGESTPVRIPTDILYTILQWLPLKASNYLYKIYYLYFLLVGGGSVTTQLNAADVEIMGSAECAAIWGGEYRADVQICITSPGQDTGSCNVCITYYYSLFKALNAKPSIYTA